MRLSVVAVTPEDLRQDFLIYLDMKIEAETNRKNFTKLAGIKRECDARIVMIEQTRETWANVEIKSR